VEAEGVCKDMNIQVHIERLILDGLSVARSQRPMLQAAVEEELSRLLENGGQVSGLQTGGMIPSMTGGAIQLTGESDPTQLGQQIAQEVYGGIGR
jgi:hypothetical protein